MNNQETAQKKAGKRSAGSVIATVILILCILVAIFAGYSAYATKAGSGVPSVFGFRPFAVQSDSMVPTFKQGDLIIDVPVKDVTQLEVGDVITFWTVINGQKALNTHRIINIEDAGNYLYFETRGDNNNMDDSSSVHQNDIVGQYKFKIAGLGTVLDFLQTTLGFGLCIVLPVAIFFIFELIAFFKTLFAYKAEKVRAEVETQMKIAQAQLAAAQAQAQSQAQDQPKVDDTTK